MIRYGGLTLCIGGLLGCSLAFSQLDHFTRQGYSYIFIFSLAFAIYLITLSAARKTKLNIWFILGIALLLRLPLWATQPTLSSDVWRYLWDGRLITNGVSPYSERVDSPQLNDLRTDLHTKIDHQWMASPYPPTAQAVFAVTYAIAPENPRAMQVVFTLFDLGVIYLLALLLQQAGQHLKWSILYAWHPLMVVEFAHGAHVDSLMTLLILGAILAVEHRYIKLSASLLAFATLTKFIPALLLPAFLRQWGWRGLLVFSLIVLGIFLPFMVLDGLSEEGTGVLGAARIYAQEWKTNDGLFFWLVEFLTPYTSDPIRLGRLISNLCLLVVGGLIFLHPTQKIILPLALLISTYLLFVFAMFPWYLTWLLALLPLLNRRPSIYLFTGAWLYFSWAVNLSYLFYLDPTQPKELMWVRYVEYLPLYLGLSLAAGLEIRDHLKFLPNRQTE